MKTVAYVHSKMSKEAIKMVFEDYRAGKLDVLVNVDMATTGMDVPTIDTLVLARATKSQNLYRQMCGRALRLAPNKDNAVLLDCCSVITNLGLPTAPIKPKKEYEEIEAKKPVCSECASKRVYRKIKDNKTYKVCAECGHREEI